MNTLILYNNKKCIEISYDKDDIDKNKAIELASDYGISGGDIGFFLLNTSKTDYKYDQKRLKIGTVEFCDVLIKADKKILVVICDGTLKVIYGSVYINGAICEDGAYELFEGDSIFISGVKVDYCKEKISITGKILNSSLNQSLNINSYDKLESEYRRSPRIYMDMQAESVEIKRPPNKPAKDKNAILKRIAAPALTLAITVGVGILLKRGIFILMSAGMMVATIVVSIVTGIQSVKERKNQEKERTDNYNKYLLNKRGSLYRLRKKQIESLKFNYPDMKAIETLCDNYSNRIYERDSNDIDFLNISVGTSDMKPLFQVKYEENMENSGEALYEEMMKLGKEFSIIENLPYVIDLKKTHLGLVGERKYVYELQKAIISQLCFFHSYHDLEIILITNGIHILDYMV